MKITILEHHVAAYVRICVFEAQKFVHLRAILAIFPDTKLQELPGASRTASGYSNTSGFVGHNLDRYVDDELCALDVSPGACRGVPRNPPR